jgi:hypothetical protein
MLLSDPVDVNIRLKVSESKKFSPGRWWECGGRHLRRRKQQKDGRS